MNARYKPRQVAQLETEFVCALIALDRYDELPVLEQEELIVTIGFRIATAVHLVIGADVADEASAVLESARQCRPASSCAGEWMAIVEAASEDLNASRSHPRPAGPTQPKPVTRAGSRMPLRVHWSRGSRDATEDRASPSFGSR